MKTRNLTNSVGGLLLAAAVAFSSSANADPVTQLIHFDDASNGWKWYSDVDKNFLFNPTNLASDTKCADSTSGGNGSCVIEGGQTNLPLMTRPENGPQSQGGGPSDPPVTSGDLLAFTLDAFYFSLTGRGTFGGNYIEVTGSNGVTTQFVLGVAYGNVTDYDLGAAAGPLDWNTGYVATLGDMFQGVNSIQFTAFGSAQVRLDCVVATFDGTTTEPLSSFDRGCGVGEPPNGVPEPGTLALLGLGLVGVGLTRRRRRV